MYTLRSRSIPLNTDYDVIVVGGGFAGTAAAVSAAREGAKVLLLEKSGFLGGAAGNCYVNPFMGYTTKIDGKTTLLSDGIFTEILDRLEKKGGLMPNRVTFSEEVLKLVFDEMTEESGVDVLFHAYLLRAERDCDRIKSVTIMGKGGEMTFEADYFIGVTGDAAGVAAAVAAQEHTDFPETDVKKIQALLRKHNAFIGE